MLFPLLQLLLASLPFISASPVIKRALSQNDIDTLQLAHYLELLELNLYSAGCSNFTDSQYTSAGFPVGFRDNICIIAGVS